MKKWYQILWGSVEEDDLVKKQIEDSPDPDDLTMENAYKTRWIWYHTILAGLMFFANIIMFGIFILLAVKL
jgi:hypothetical protein|tara:strand:+ start:828 stop:1040 length:213 start_codon:yes stop_codon:yes gene_type:complete